MPAPLPMRIQLAWNYARVQSEFTDTVDHAFQRMRARAVDRGNYAVLSIIDDRSVTLLNRVQRHLLAHELESVLDDPDVLGDAAPMVHKVLLAIELLERGQRKFLVFMPPEFGFAVADGLG